MIKNKPNNQQNIDQRCFIFILPLVYLAAYCFFNRRQFFFDDELYTLKICAAPWSEFLTSLKVIDIHPPLSYSLLKIWFFLFGTNLFTSQLFSLICIALGLYAYLRAWSRQFPQIKWLFFLMVIHPLLILWGGSARYYPFFFFITNLGILYFVNIMNKDYSVKNLIIYIFVTILGIYSENTYFLMFIPQCLMISGRMFITRGIKERQFFRRFAIGLLVLVISYVPWLQFACNSLFSNYLVRPEKPHLLVNLAFILYGSFLGQSIMPYQLGVVLPAAVVLGFLFFFGARKMYADDRSKFLLWAGLSGGILLLTMQIRLLAMRHFLMISGLVLLPVLYFISSVRKKPVKFILFMAVLAVYLYGDVNILLKRNLHKGGLADPIPAIAQAFAQKISADNKSLGIYYSGVLDYYLKEHGLKNGRYFYFEAEQESNCKELTAIFNQKPVRIVYVWNYYGHYPPATQLERQITAFLGRDYILVSQDNFIEDLRLAKIGKFIPIDISNPRKYRYIIQEYLLRSDKPK